jgi:serine protease inhibitor
MIAIIVFLLIGIGIFLFMGGGIGGNDKEKGNQGNKTGGGDDLPPSKVIGLSEFDVKLLQDFQEDKNVVYSPMSIKYAMSVLMEGTDGSTKQELVDVIGNYEPNKYTYSEHLNIANAIFVKDSFKNAIRTSYTDAIKEKYGANTIYDPFNSAATINDWVYTNTLKLIPKIVSDDDLQDAVFVIGNTVAIDMEWVNEIQCEMGNMSKCKDGKMYNVSYANEKYSDYVRSYSDQNRAEMKLNNKDSLALEFGASINNYDIVSKLGESTIRSTVKEAYDKCIAERKSEYECSLVGADTIDEYLDNYVKEIGENYGKVDVSTDFKMYIDDDVKMFAKDFKEYDGAQFQYIGIMPTKANLKDYVNNLTVDKLSSLIGGLKEVKSENFADGKITRIKGVLPEFEFDEKFDLVKEFQDLGVKKAFQDDADLSKMLADGVDEVKVGAIKHAAKIQFTNTGVKAAAATAIVGVGNALDASFEYLFDVPVEEIDMTFDKPFMYLIRDKATEEVWFMGTVYEGTAPKK